ncbi:F-box/LRR-repeat protein [Trifolium repens]|nr:F-box/LRR-repeat protein [Trifolium repens]
MDSYLSNDCWESIFRFIINNDDDHNRNLNSVSLVCKQFLPVTDRLRSSCTISNSTINNLPVSNTVYHSTHSFFRHFFERYTNLNSLNLINMNELFIDYDKLLCQIYCFPFKLTSLNLSKIPTFPEDGLGAFAQKITTLTSLTCSHIQSLYSSDLFLIAEYFPLLEELGLSYPSGYTKYASYVDGVEALSLALIKLRKVNLYGFPVNNQSLFHLFNNCKYLEEVIMFDCHKITSTGLASALRLRPTLRSLSFSITPSNPEYTQMFTTSHFIDSLVNLKGLTCLVLKWLHISNNLLYCIAREGLPLTRLVLQNCTCYSYDGIFCLLTKCQLIQHLDLQGADFLNDQHVVELSLYLGDLMSINFCHCLKLTKSALFALVRNCPSLSEIKIENIGRKIVRNSSLLVSFGVYYPQLKSLYLGNNAWLSDESIIMFASKFPNLQLLDLNSCNGISEGICQVLKRCCKIRHLNLANCSKVKLLGLNFVVSKLEVLNLSNTNVNDETLYVISKYCCGLYELLLGLCYDVTETGLKHVIENCTQLRVLR